MREYSSHFLLLTYINFFIFFFFPYYSFYSLVLLFLWLCYAYFQGVIKVRKSAYFYFSGLLFFFLLLSIALKGYWVSFGIFLPFLIPLAFLFFGSLLKVRNYSKGLLFLCIGFLLVYGYNIFFPNTSFYIAVQQINLSQFLATCFLFIPIFWTGLFEKNIYWKYLQLLFVAVLLLAIVLKLQIFYLLVFIYTILLFVGIWQRKKYYYYILFFFWPVLFAILAILSKFFSSTQQLFFIQLQAFFIQLQALQGLVQIHFIQDFSLLGNGHWVQNANNTYQQFYLSFGFLGLLGFLLLITSFVIAVFFTMKRKITINNLDTKILWSYSCSIILFFVLLFFYPNFINPMIFYFVMALWGVALGYVDAVRSYKKKRI